MNAVSVLRVYADHQPAQPLFATNDRVEAGRLLGEAGVLFAQWQSSAPVCAGDPPEHVLAAYAREVEQLKEQGGYVTVDVVSMGPDHPQKEALRAKFLSEHRHAEDEVRFFVEGRGLFSLHIDDKVFEVLCEQGDLISVPRGTPHWFDMGSAPSFVAIRLFIQPEGWVAHYTGSDIASRFSRLET